MNEFFKKCPKKPDIYAFSETKVKDYFPNFPNYNFENVNSSTSAGGVGIYLSKKLNYNVCSSLSMNVNHCEDIWLKVDINENDNLIIFIDVNFQPDES